MSILRRQRGQSIAEENAVLFWIYVCQMYKCQVLRWPKTYGIISFLFNQTLLCNQNDSSNTRVHRLQHCVFHCLLMCGTTWLIWLSKFQVTNVGFVLSKNKQSRPNRKLLLLIKHFEMISQINFTTHRSAQTHSDETNVTHKYIRTHSGYICRK